MSTAIVTADAWVEELRLPSGHRNAAFERMQASSYSRDLRLNLKSILEGDVLDARERALLCLSIAANERNTTLVESFSAIAAEAGASEAEIAEAIACASLLSANNVLYRFRHFMGKESYAKMPARLRMNVMLKPETGKELFELMSLAVSAVNGCEACVKAHEHSLLELGSSEARVWEAIRIASVVRSLSCVI